MTENGHHKKSINGSTCGTITDRGFQMSKCDSLLAKARNNPKGLRFQELVSLAKCNGWIFVRQNGSHHMFKKEGVRELMDFQEGSNGDAKAYQVRQLLNTIED